jgi:peptidoglycan/LPS O-acetylase OafA/YrhL
MRASDRPEALRPPPGHVDFPLADALRGAAALAVVVYHIALSTGGQWNPYYGPLISRFPIGIAIFFGLSGFLLYRPFVAADLGVAPRSLRVGDFLRRRALRILPAFYVVMLVIALLPAFYELLPEYKGSLGHDWWAYFGFLQIYGNHTALTGLQAAWTLDVEAVFYLLLPVYALTIRRLHGRLGERRALVELVALAAVVVLSLVAHALVQPDAARPAATAYLQHMPPAYMGWFAVGMMLAVVSAEWTRRHGSLPRVGARTTALCWLAAAAVALAGPALADIPRSVGLHYSGFGWEFEWITYTLGGALFLAPVALGAGTGRRLGVLGRALSWVGLVSLGLYLWHGPVLSYVGNHGGIGWLGGAPFVGFLMVALPASLLVGALSYYLVELSFLRLKEREPLLGRLRGRPGAPTVERVPEPEKAVG